MYSESKASGYNLTDTTICNSVNCMWVWW